MTWKVEKTNAAQLGSGLLRENNNKLNKKKIGGKMPVKMSEYW